MERNGASQSSAAGRTRARPASRAQQASEQTRTGHAVAQTLRRVALEHPETSEIMCALADAFADGDVRGLLEVRGVARRLARRRARRLAAEHARLQAAGGPVKTPRKLAEGDDDPRSAREADDVHLRRTLELVVRPVRAGSPSGRAAKLAQTVRSWDRHIGTFVDMSDPEMTRRIARALDAIAPSAGAPFDAAAATRSVVRALRA